MNPTWQSDCGTVSLYQGDCLEILPALTSIDAVVTDPPYGCNNDGDYTRFTGGLSKEGRQDLGSVIGDDKPFDPSPWLRFRYVILWGYQYYASKLPVGAILVWLKKRDNQFHTVLADAEIAWYNHGHGVHVMRHIWNGFDRESERGERQIHPTQKPVAVMGWCVSKTKGTVLDPYMGSGSTGVACVRVGRPFVGIEIDEHHFETAKERLQTELMQTRLVGF